MREEKVVRIRPNALAADAEPTQLDLFGSAQNSANFFCFLAIDDFNQDELIEIITRNAVSTIVDLRPEPVFRSPNFNHRQLTSYLYDRGIRYLEYAVVKLDPEAFSPWRIARSVNRARPRGLTLWIYDTASKESGWFDLAKSQLSKSRLFRAELSPRALRL